MLEKIKEILVEQLNCDADSINEDTSFKDDLGADSLDLYEMVMALEDEYGIENQKSGEKKKEQCKNKICTEPDRPDA